MFSTLIIPDVHGDLPTLKALAPAIDEADRVVMLGDLFDSFQPYDAEGICEWTLEHIYNPKFVFIHGNHDAHYFFNHPYFRCSGYQKVTQKLVDELLSTKERRQFKLWTEVGPFTVSHAGFHDKTMRYKTPQDHETALDAAFNGMFHPLFMPGSARGGFGVGGVTWLDWQYEFQDLPKLPQIVGHSRRDGIVRKKGRSYCIDSGLQAVCWVNGGDIEIVRV